MDNNKIETISNLFEDKEIRSVWDSEKEEYFFSVVDVISALTDSNIPRNYWSDLKRKLKSEGSELHENIVQLKMKAQDGKMRETDSLDTKGILRLISINDNIDGLNDEEDSYLLKGLLNIYNESYTRDISNKVKTALITKKINGEFVTFLCTIWI